MFSLVVRDPHGVPLIPVACTILSQRMAGSLLCRALQVREAHNLVGFSVWGFTEAEVLESADVFGV